MSGPQHDPSLYTHRDTVPITRALISVSDKRGLAELVQGLATSGVEIPQLRIPGIFGVWAAAALPMAVLAWLAAPALAGRFAGDGIVPMFKALIVCLDLGLVWQFVLVAILVGREQRTLRWSTVREALWLRSPRSPRSGRVGVEFARRALT